MFWKPKGEDGEAMFDVSKFIQIWPIYINSTLTQQQGRRMPKDSCCKCIHISNNVECMPACTCISSLALTHIIMFPGSDPVVYEMSEICQSYGLRHVIEV